MIPNELLYGLIGLVSALLAGRLGLPIFASRAPTSTDLRELVRQALLEILQGLNEPRPSFDDEIRRQLQSILAAQDK